MTLRHLLIATAGLFPVLLLLGVVGQKTEGLGTPLRLLLSGGAVLATGACMLTLIWHACRLFRFPPLFILASSCPHCGRRPAVYGLRTDDWPKTLLACTLCGGIFILWMARRVRPELLDLDVPTYALRWPEFVGRWRRVG